MKFEQHGEYPDGVFFLIFSLFTLLGAAINICSILQDKLYN